MTKGLTDAELFGSSPATQPPIATTPVDQSGGLTDEELFPVSTEPQGQGISLSNWLPDEYNPTTEPGSLAHEVATGYMNVTGGFNKRLTGLIDTPIQAMNELLQMSGVTDDESIIPTLTEGAKASGINVEPEEGALATRAGEFAFDAAAVQLALLKAAQAGVVLTSTVGKYLQPMIEYTAKSPLKSTLISLGIIPTAVAGEKVVGDVAAENLGEGYRASGELVGNLVGSITPSVVMAPVRSLTRAAGNALGVTKEAQTRTAAKVLEANSLDSSKAQIMDDSIQPPQVTNPKTGQLEDATVSTGEILDDPFLMNLQRIVTPDKRAYRINQLKQQEMADTVQEFGGDVATVDKLKAISVFSDKVASTVVKVKDRVTKALENSKKIASKLDVKGNMDEISSKSNTQIRAAEDMAKKEENALYEAVVDGKFDVSSPKKVAKELILSKETISSVDDYDPILFELADFTPTEIKNLPKKVQALIKANKEVSLKNTSTSAQVNALRTRLNEIRRDADGAGKFNKGRLIGKVVDSLIDDIQPLNKASVVALKQTEKARAFSRSMHDTFTKGPLGRLLGYTRSGEVRTTGEKLLSKVLSNANGSKGYEALEKSMAGDPAKITEMRQGVSEFMKAKFAYKVLDDNGVVNPGKVKKFIADNEHVLQYFGDLKTTMLDARSAEALAQSVGKAGAGRVKLIETQAAASRYTNGEVATQMESVLKSKTPQKDMKSLINLARKDPTGEALKGIKGSFFDSMRARITGQEGYSPEQLASFVKNNKPLIKQLYGEEGLGILEATSKGASIGSRTAPKMRTQEESLLAAKGQSLKAFSGGVGIIVGTRLGKLLGGHTMATAGIGKRVFEKIPGMTKLLSSSADDAMFMLENALQDKQLAKALYTKVDDLNKQQLDRLNKWLTKTAIATKGEAIPDERSRPPRL